MIQRLGTSHPKFLSFVLAAVLSTGCVARYEQIPGSDALSSLDGGGAGDSGGNLTGAPLTPAQVAEYCARYTLKQSTFALNFPRSPNQCPWDQGDNLSMVEGGFQAREEQVLSLNLPPGAVICDMKFEVLSSSFVYDDEFVFDYNGLVLASSIDVTPAFARVGNFFDYDWMGIRGRQWSSFSQNAYCAGADRGLGTCSWPDTQTQGSFNVNYSQQLIQEFSALTAQDARHEFRFTTSGDNDVSIDCSHAPVHLKLQVTYVQ